MLQKILKFVFENKKSFLFFGMFLSLFFLSYSTGFATGDEPVLKPEDADKVVKILNGFIMGAAALMGMVTSFITIFLYPGWVNGTIFGLDSYLKEIWILVSNVVYFIFAFILIAIAFMNIVGKGEGTWELKQAMPKFIVGVLIVPFSWFFIQLVLSVSSVLTVGVLTLPYDSFQGKEEFEAALDDPLFAEQKICKDIVIAFDGEFDGQATELNSGGSESQLNENVKCKSDDSKVTVREILTGIDENGQASADGGALQNSIFGIMSIYTYGILRVHELDTITGSDLESLKTIADLIFKIVFDLLFIIVYLLLMVALLLALFTRGIRLWIYAMLSPVFGLLYFFGKGSEGFGSDSNKFSISEFIALALVPVYVSAALAFGLVFILVASHGIKETNPDSDTLTAGGFSLTILGAHGDGESEKSVIGKLIVEIFGIVILWIAVMFALRQSEVTKQITQPIADFGKSVGDLAAKSPTYAPIIPSSMGGSVAGLSAMGKSVTSGIDSHFRSQGSERGAEFAKQFGAGGTSESVLRSMVTNNQTGLENNDRASMGNVLDEMREQSTTESLSRRTYRTEFVKSLSEVMRNNNKESVMDQADITRLAGLSGAAFTDALARFIKEHQGELSTESRQALTDAGINPSSVDGTVINNAFTMGQSGTGTGDSDTTEGTTPTPSGATNITINTDLSGVITSGGDLDTSVIDTLKTEIGESNLTEANKAVIEEAIESRRGDLTSDQVTKIITELLK